MIRHLPIFTCAEARQHEKMLFKGDPTLAEAAMKRAGTALGKLLSDDILAYIDGEEVPELVLMLGKGNNTGDALYAAKAFAESWPDTSITLLCCWNPNTWNDSTHRAFESLQASAEITAIIDLGTEEDLESRIREILTSKECAVVIDGIFGMSFKPPMRDIPAELIELINGEEDIRLRVAVDMPSGLSDYASDDSECFQADVTYATGILKTPAVSESEKSVGRLRMIPLGFFEKPLINEGKHVYSPRALTNYPRKPDTDKRTFGHIFIVAGSRKMPGALMMSTRAAIRSGVGLVTVCAPESVCALAVTHYPEAMWIPAPESHEGTLTPKTKTLFFQSAARATALLIGPGIGPSEEAQDLIENLIHESEGIPLILDADALQPRQIEAAAATKFKRPGTIITPHAGELFRISSGREMQDLAKHIGGIIVEKGPRTWIHSDEQSSLIPFGNPVLARGGSGDILAGLVAGCVAANPSELFDATCYAAAIHARASDRLASAKGEKHVATTDLLDFIKI